MPYFQARGRMPAIVLTCQRYAPLAEHMIAAYGSLWPDHPFRFRLPDGRAMREVAGRMPDVVELVPTPEGEGRGRFRAAVLGLLDGLHDDAWVYWCIDDKYPVWIDLFVARRVAEAVPAQPADVAGLCVASRRVDRLRPGLAASRPLHIAGLAFRRRADYRRIWLHQFLRAKVLRRLFAAFPDVIDSAKDMDALLKKVELSPEHPCYVLDGNAIMFGESTHRGRLTVNCAESLRRHRGIPEGFEIASRRMMIGDRPAWWRRLGAAVVRSAHRPGRPLEPRIG